MNADKLVQNEIYYNVSMLINELAQDERYTDELFEIMVQDDSETAVRDNATDKEIQNALEWIGYDSMDELDANDWRELAEYLDIEPYHNEALEHWIVSDWLADRLEQHGEMVIRDFKGLTIWGRTTSGQAISMDYIIQKIADQ